MPHFFGNKLGQNPPKGVQITSRRNVLIAGSAGALLSACSKPTSSKSNKETQNKAPNIVFIMADDLGFADLSCYGRRDYETPHIDKLASQGVRYLQAYANSSVCSATRTALITGRYQYRVPVGLEEPLVPFRHLGLDPDLPTLPSILKSTGYSTALIGKWHLGALPDYSPLKSGYDHFWGYRGGTVDYFTHNGVTGPDLWDGDTKIEEDGYLTDLLGQRTIQMVDLFSKSDKPFFISLHFSAPHWPWEGPEDEDEAKRILRKEDKLTSLMNFDGGDLKTYASIVRRMDEQVGKILSALDRNGIADNTIVVFTSDNGGERFSDTWPFSGKKTELLEGGLRIPCIVRWPGRLPKGETTNDVCMSMDWLPTLLNAAGTQANLNFPTDGIDLFTNMNSKEHANRTLFWRYKHLDQEACRDGNWKYLKIQDNTFLFNVEDDPLERANLKMRNPEIYTSLVEKYKAWEATMLPIEESTFTNGFTAGQLADHFGVKAPDYAIKK